MNIVKNILGTTIFVIWFVITLLATIYLLSYNDYSISQIGSYSFIVVDNDELEPDYEEGDLLIAKKISNKKINVGDTIIFARPGYSNELLINIAEVNAREDVTSKESSFTVGTTKYSSEYVLGTTTSTTVIHKVGTIVGIVSSKWGFVFGIIFPTLFVIVYETMMVIEEIKSAKYDEA